MPKINAPSSSGTSSRLSDIPVLIVEDDPAGARMLVALFESEGAIVRHAGSAEDALLILRDFRAQVAIVDLVLPTLSGLMFVEHCKSHPALKTVIAVAVSAMNGPKLEALALKTGCAAYLRKPLDVEHVVRVVVSHLKGQS